METHAHHLHKAPGQKFWHYSFEFLMLFLAVFCGFMAEYRLEHQIEREREKEFIISAIKEMKYDLRFISGYEQDSSRSKNLDTLSRLLLSRDRSQLAMQKMYRLGFNIQTNWYVPFKRNTLTQLKNSGNMRLIRNSAVVDSLSSWDGSITHSFVVLEDLKKFSTENLSLACKIFDSSYFIRDGKWISFDETLNQKLKFRFLTNDKLLLHELGNRINIQSQTQIEYDYCIYYHKLYTKRLIDFLLKTYKIKKLE